MKKAYLVLIVIFLSSLGMLDNMKNLETNLSPEAFLSKTDPVLVEYKEFRKEYDLNDYLVVALERDEIFF